MVALARAWCRCCACMRGGVAEPGELLARRESAITLYTPAIRDSFTKKLPRAASRYGMRISCMMKGSRDAVLAHAWVMDMLSVWMMTLRCNIYFIFVHPAATIAKSSCQAMLIPLLFNCWCGSHGSLSQAPSIYAPWPIAPAASV